MNREVYLQELGERLRFRGAPRQRMRDIVAEVDSHLTESGEDPIEAFGTPDRYAARLLRGRWHTARFAAALTVAMGAGTLVAETVSAWHAAEPVVTVTVRSLPPAAMALAVVLTMQLPAVLRRLPNPNVRLPLAFATALPMAYLAALASDSRLGQHTLVSLAPATAWAVSAALVITLIAAWAGRWLMRRQRGA